MEQSLHQVTLESESCEWQDYIVNQKIECFCEASEITQKIQYHISLSLCHQKIWAHFYGKARKFILTIRVFLSGKVSHKALLRQLVIKCEEICFLRIAKLKIVSFVFKQVVSYFRQNIAGIFFVDLNLIKSRFINK